jgi:hypothetical protein
MGARVFSNNLMNSALGALALDEWRRIAGGEQGLPSSGSDMQALSVPCEYERVHHSSYVVSLLSEKLACSRRRCRS